MSKKAEPIVRQDVHWDWGGVKVTHWILIGKERYPLTDAQWERYQQYLAGEGEVMRTLFIGGSRHMTAGMETTLREYIQNLSQTDPDVYLITGDANGIDYAAQKLACEYNFVYTVYSPYASPRWYYNSDLARFLQVGRDYSERDKFLCGRCEEAWFFWDGNSKGTYANIARMKALNKPYHVWRLASNPKTREADK